MIVKYDALSSFEMPIFTLCNPGSEYHNGYLSDTVGIIPNHSDEECVLNFNAPSELNFRVTRTEFDDVEENKHFLKMYKGLENKRLIFMKDMGYFIIDTVDTGYDESGHFKDITARSIEEEISQKAIPYIPDNTYKFYDKTNSPAPDDKKCLLNMIVEILPKWTIGEVDPIIAERYRTFEDVDFSRNCLSFLLEDVQEAYECIFIFDIMHRVINVFDQNNYVRKTNIHLTEDDLIMSMNYKEDSTDLYTAMTVLGGENITISGINPLGTNTLYKFDHYLNWMSEPLSKKVTAWQKEVEENEKPYYDLSLEYYKGLTEANNLDLELQRLNLQADLYVKCRNNIVASNGYFMVDKYNDAIAKNGGQKVDIQSDVQATLAYIDSLRSSVDASIAKVTSDISILNERLKTLKAQMTAIYDKLAIKKYFTQPEYDELAYYIFEGNYNDEFVIITDQMTHEEKFNQMKILYDRAKHQLQKSALPTQEYHVEVGSFIFDNKFKKWTEQLETGCLINVELEQGDVAPLFLSAIIINYEEKRVDMEFGNRFNKFDPKTLFNKMLGNISKSANSISYVKDTIHPIKEGVFGELTQAISSSRDLTMESALSSEDEEFVVDGSGCTARRKLDNGEYDPKQLKIIGKSIVFTDDAWDSCRTAVGEIVSPDGAKTYGINAESLLGNLIIGNKLKIIDKDGNEMFSVIDGKINASVGAVSERVDKISVSVDKSIRQVFVEYAQNDSSDTPPVKGWEPVPPTWTEGLYIWSRTTTLLNDNSRIDTDPVCITGAKGASGNTGQGVQSITQEYYLSTSKTEQLGGVWETSPREWISGHYMWLRSHIVYENPASEDWTVPICSSEWEAVNELVPDVEKAKADATSAQTEAMTARGETQKIFLDLQDSIGHISEEVDQLNSKTKLMMTENDVTIAIQKILREDGVDKIKTGMGFTFDDSGLNITRTNGGIPGKLATNINEDGMRITRNGATVLTADNTGVYARNLHATTYLIVGEHCRFEELTDKPNRTGMFYIK